MNRRRANSDSGFSIAEVLIAMVILVSAGSILINGLVTNQKVNTKVTGQSLRLGMLSTAESIVTAAPFAGCKKITNTDPETKSFPYTNLALPTGVTVEKVEWISKTKQWRSCSVSSNEAITMQRVVLKYQKDSVLLRRTVLKVFQADFTSYTSGYLVKINSASALKREMGPVPGRSDASSVNLNLSATSNSTNTCYSLLSSQLTLNSSPPFNFAVLGGSDSTDPRCGSGVQLRLSGVTSSTPTGTYTIDVGGYSPDNGEIAYPATLVVRVRATLKFDFLVQYQGSGSSWIDSDSTTGCRSFSSKQCRILITPFPGFGSFNYSTNADYGIRVNTYTLTSGVTAIPVANISVSPAIASTTEYLVSATTGAVTFTFSKGSGNGTPCNTSGPTSFTLTLTLSDYGIYQSTGTSPAVDPQISIPVVCGA